MASLDLNPGVPFETIRNARQLNVNIAATSLIKDLAQRLPAEYQKFLNKIHGMSDAAASDLARRLDWSPSKRE